MAGQSHLVRGLTSTALKRSGMSPFRSSESAKAGSPGQHPGMAQQFALRLQLQCRLVQPSFEPDRTFEGESVNIGSKVLVFKTDEILLPRQLVEASLDWPARLDNSTRLKLVVKGRIVTIVGDRITMGIQWYEFKTRSAIASRSRGA